MAVPRRTMHFLARAAGTRRPLRTFTGPLLATRRRRVLALLAGLLLLALTFGGRWLPTGYVTARCLLTTEERSRMSELTGLVGAVLDEFKVDWWADSGTLLGQQRRGDVIPWDKDVDLGYLAKDHALMDTLAFAAALRRRGVFMHGRNFVFEQDRALLVRDHEAVTVKVDMTRFDPVAGTTMLRRGDVFVRDRDSWRVRLSKYLIRTQFLPDADTHNLFPLQRRQPFGKGPGGYVHVPRNPNAYLVALYGPQWRVERPYKVQCYVNGKDGPSN